MKKNLKSAKINEFHGSLLSISICILQIGIVWLAAMTYSSTNQDWWCLRLVGFRLFCMKSAICSFKTELTLRLKETVVVNHFVNAWSNLNVPPHLKENWNLPFSRYSWMMLLLKGILSLIPHYCFYVFLFNYYLELLIHISVFSTVVLFPSITALGFIFIQFQIQLTKILSHSSTLNHVLCNLTF